MQSPTDQDSAIEPTAQFASKGFKHWNRKLHYYTGLFLLFFIWLFSFSGLLLNHQWNFTEFWENRRQTSNERDITTPPTGGDLVQARNIVAQLGIGGEIEWTTSRSDNSRIDFRVSRPGHIYEVKADLNRKRASVQHIDLNTWGVIRLLHSFTGVRLDDSRNQRDWFLTSIWAFAMDGVAAGLILLVLGSLFMWWELPDKRKLGAVFLLLGTVGSGLFWFGLRWLY